MNAKTKRILPVAFVLVFFVVVALILLPFALSGGAQGTVRLQVTIPATPTASMSSLERETQPDFPLDSKPAFAVLRDAQRAMQQVSSYHFELDNSMDSYTIADHEAADITGDSEKAPILIDGDVTPPAARFSVQNSVAYRGMLVIGMDRYAQVRDLFGGPSQYVKIVVPADDWHILNGALHNPQQYINYTLDTALCGSILDEHRQIEGANTLHTRFILPHDEVSTRDNTGRRHYVRDIWIDQETTYLRRVQVRELYTRGQACTAGMQYELHEADIGFISFTSGILTYSRYNEPVVPPIP